MFYNVYVWYEVSDNHVNLIPKTALAASPSVGVTDVRMSRARRLAACIFSLCSSTIHANNTSVVHSQWSRLNEARLSLVESFIVLLCECLLCHKEPARSKQKAPSRGLFAFQSP